MKTLNLWTALAAVAVLTLTLAAAPAPAADDVLATQVSLLVGYPNAEGDASDVIVVPGTVIAAPLGGHPFRWSELGDEEAQGVRLAKLAQSLEQTLRLDKVEVRHRQPLKLEVGVETDLLPPSADSNLRMTIRLLGFSDTVASYEVQVFERSNVVADTKATATRGNRAIVGARDGDAAPYVFLVVEPAGTEAVRPMFVGGEVVPPRVINKVAPAYTEEARKDRIQGVVIVQTVIDETGHIQDVETLKGLPEGLTEAAVDAIRQWTFEPATLDGQPVAVYYNLTINFRLDSEKKTD